MIKFNKPDKLNGEQLRNELIAVGVIINSSPQVEGNDLYLDIVAKDETKAKKIVDNHIGVDIIKPELTFEEKLENLGLDLEDLKTALGL